MKTGGLCENGDPFTATGNGHVPPLGIRSRFDSGIGEQRMIDSRTLGPTTTVRRVLSITGCQAIADAGLRLD